MWSRPDPVSHGSGGESHFSRVKPSWSCLLQCQEVLGCGFAVSQLCTEHGAHTGKPCRENPRISAGGPPEGGSGAWLGREGLMGYGQTGEGVKELLLKVRDGEKFSSQLLFSWRVWPDGAISFLGGIFCYCKGKIQTGPAQHALCAHQPQIPTDSPGKPLRALLK